MNPAPANDSAAQAQPVRNLFKGDWLVCFAVKEEANSFTPPDRSVRTLVTGMGRVNAERALRSAIANRRPVFVLTCGFAGGLDPSLTKGTVLFSPGTDPRFEPLLRAAGARVAKFLCAERVAATAVEKSALRRSTGADAVEMESQHICALCRKEGIPCATLRVVLDTAEEDLPLDFNSLMTADYQMDYRKLGLVLLKSPSKVRLLLRLQKESRRAAQTLATSLHKLLA